MIAPVDLTDIPVVTAAELWPIVEATISPRMSELVSAPLSQQQIDAVLRAFWSAHEGTGAQGLALSHRLIALLQGLSRRRFARLIHKQPHEVLQAAVNAAATLRLNAKWGFNPMRFAAALHAAAERLHRTPKPATRRNTFDTRFNRDPTVGSGGGGRSGHWPIIAGHALDFPREMN